MSYILKIWEPRPGEPTPADLSGVVSLLARLERSPASGRAPHLLEKSGESLPILILRQDEWLRDSEAEFIDTRDHDYRLRRESELPAVLRHVAEQTESVLLGILDECQTLAGTDRLLNTQPLSESVFFHGYDGTEGNVAVAYLARNPRLRRLRTRPPAALGTLVSFTRETSLR